MTPDKDEIRWKICQRLEKLNMYFANQKKRGAIRCTDKCAISLPFLIHRWFHVKHSFAIHPQHDLGDKYAVLTGKITCSAVFFTDAADGLDAEPSELRLED